MTVHTVKVHHRGRYGQDFRVSSNDKVDVTEASKSQVYDQIRSEQDEGETSDEMMECHCSTVA